ncbi:MAG TPA: chalcone isomerase family protein, partial [Anaeromyxobacteraceae bacterium]|nr:chalcone isomerase family protein [Anaeromyxobacteraceae bacterium]
MRHVVAAAAALLVLAVPALAAEVAGVKVPDTMEVGGQTLKLNGAGLRKKFVVKVYTGALYLPQKTTDAKQAITANQPKAVRMTFLRNLEKDQVLGAFREGFEKNSRADLKEILPGLD